jgi:hypothetical protein
MKKNGGGWVAGWLAEFLLSVQHTTAKKGQCLKLVKVDVS